MVTLGQDTKNKIYLQKIVGAAPLKKRVNKKNKKMPPRVNVGVEHK